MYRFMTIKAAAIHNVKSPNHWFIIAEQIAEYVINDCIHDFAGAASMRDLHRYCKMHEGLRTIDISVTFGGSNTLTGDIDKHTRYRYTNHYTISINQHNSQVT